MTTKHVPTEAEGTTDLKTELQRLAEVGGKVIPQEVGISQYDAFRDAMFAEALLELLAKVETFAARMEAIERRVFPPIMIDSARTDEAWLTNSP